MLLLVHSNSNPKDHLLFSSSYLSVRLLSSSYKNEGLRCERFLKGEAKRPTRELAVVKRVLSDCRRIELFWSSVRETLICLFVKICLCSWILLVDFFYAGVVEFVESYITFLFGKIMFMGFDCWYFPWRNKTLLFLDYYYYLTKSFVYCNWAFFSPIPLPLRIATKEKRKRKVFILLLPFSFSFMLL